MLTREEFESLSYEEKCEFVFTYGIVCALKENSTHLINLYKIGNYYVEAWFGKSSNIFEDFVVISNQVEIYADKITQRITFRILS
jgi:hypothetical protein